MANKETDPVPNREPLKELMAYVKKLHEEGKSRMDESDKPENEKPETTWVGGIPVTIMPKDPNAKKVELGIPAPPGGDTESFKKNPPKPKNPFDKGGPSGPAVG